MYRKPTDKQLAKVPAMNPESTVPLAEKKIYMHFFVGSCDWYAVEWDVETREFFGYVNLGDDMNAEWGYFSLDKLISLHVGPFEVDYDRHWDVRQVKDIPEIKKF